MKQSIRTTSRMTLHFVLLVALVTGFLAIGGAQPTRAAGMIVVDSAADAAADDGQCTLREAITAANTDTASGATAGECAAGSSADAITFAADYTITLGSQLPVVTSAISISGNGRANTIIQANAAPYTALYRVFEVGGAGNLTLDGVTVRHGQGLAFGGGIYNGGTLTMTNSALSSNRARISGSTTSSGGGIYNGGTLTMTNSILLSNNAVLGGGIHNNGGTLTVTNSALSGNTANQSGGGIYSTGGAAVTGSTLSGNATGTTGGGIHTEGTLTLTNSTLVSNSTGLYGGGIFNRHGTAAITNSTLFGNMSDFGGLNNSSGSVTMTNSLIMNSSNGNCRNSGTLTAGASNIADDASCGSVTVKTETEIALLPLQENGGSTPTMALAPGSAAIDAGNDTYANAAGLTTDQRGTGFDRISGARVDVGAFEVQSQTVLCEPGSYDSGAGCVPADPGHYVPDAGATVQTPCTPGTYQPNAGSVSCIAADAGHYVDVTGASSQMECSAGSFQPNTGSTSCSLADPGHYVDVVAAASQIECAAGSFQPNSGSTSCSLPDPGHYVPVSGAAEQTPCALGTYQPNAGAVSCIAAEAGHYVDVTAAAMQIDCLPGSYQPNEAATNCILASPGYYVPVSAAIEQSACPVGTISEAGATECTLAPDITAPTITLTTPANGATYLLNQSVIAGYACQDEAGGSGLASCAGTVANGSAIDTSSVSAKSFAVNAADNAGNPNSAAVSYNVLYGFSGFSSPVDSAPTLNVAKAGQAIPLKWRITDANGSPVTNLSGVTVTVVSLSCSLGTTTDALEEYASGSSGLQNLGNGYYQFNWKTPKTYENSCKTLKLNLGEGAGFEHTALFKFTR